MTTSDRPPASPVRVCHVIHDLRRGGAEHLLVDLAALAPRAGIEMSLLSLMATDGYGYAQDLAHLGVEVHTLGLKTRWDPRGPRRALRHLSRSRPHVLHTHLKHADVVGARASRRLGIPMVSTLHLVESEVGPMGRLKRGAAGRARIRTAARTIAVSDAVRRWYLDSFRVDPSTVVTIRNGIVAPRATAADRRAVRAELGVSDGRLLAVTVAIMRLGKGHADLLEAAAILPAAMPVVFALVGTGPERDRLLARARDLGVLGDRVLFPGFRSDVDRVFAAADLAVHPSHHDALPTSLIRALAAAVPVVATSVGGIPEIVGDEAGVLVAPGDPAALASGVGRLVGDPTTRCLMGKRARERFDNEFDGEVWVARLRAVYDEARGLSGSDC